MNPPLVDLNYMNIYLDIDGVLLANDKQPALYVKEFIKYVTDNYPTYWLSTHCKGYTGPALYILSLSLDKETVEIARKIKPTDWVTSKTEGIDFDNPFLWLDDYIFDFEKQDLIKHNALNSWVKVDLSKNIFQLRDLVSNFKLTSNQAKHP
jgi:hypothetical protein